MKRIDIILNTLQNLDKGQGVSTTDISNECQLSRANVSSDLNKLCKMGKVEKLCHSRPVLYKLKPNICSNKNILDAFYDNNKSMHTCIEQAKSAVLYPPNGMNMILLGETGVGKSMFANIIYKYSVDIGRLNEQSPFIVFNCADYTNNKELLLSQLFGVKKGSYTGASSDKAGLIEEAHKGILFLDEVHRLPPEGQEMLFTFIDRGVFRRLGETNTEREADVLIILATTEDPSNALLKTFTRRIPMVINIPNLKDRTIEERFNLISMFFKEESKRLNMPIKVSINSLRSFLSYDCHNNIGQLKTDIKLTCAKAYANLISKGRSELCICSCELLPYIRDGLYKDIEHRAIWSKFVDITKRYCIFNYDNDNILFEENVSENDVYELIELKMNEYVIQGVESKKVSDQLSFEIDNYFYKYFSYNYAGKDLKSIENLVGRDITNTVYEIKQYVETKIEKFISRKGFIALCIHIDKAVKRIQSQKTIINPKIHDIEQKFNLEFNLSLDCLKIIEKNFDIIMPKDEAGFLALILSHETRNNENKQENKNVIVIVIAHGSHTATSIAQVVNTLLHIDYAIGINALLDKKPKEILQQLKETIKLQGSNRDVLLLVDMGSLINFGVEIQKEFNINVKTIPLVSTLHALEATRKAINGYDLNSIFKDTMAVNGIFDTIPFDIEETVKSKYKIITICSTGVGSANAIINILESKLEYDKDLFEIIPISFKSEAEVLEKIESFDKVIFIVSFFELKYNKPFFTIEELIDGTCIQQMQDIIDIENTYSKISESLKAHVKNIDVSKAVENAKLFVSIISKKLNLELQTKELIGIVFHVVCMLDRMMINEKSVTFENKTQYIKKNQLLYNIIQGECTVLNNIYSVSIPLDEVCHLMNLLEPRKYL